MSNLQETYVSLFLPDILIITQTSNNDRFQSIYLFLFQDGDLLLTPNLRNDRSQTVLIVPNLQADDEGTYWCKARNVHGEVNATFPVKVYGKT